MDSPTDWVAVSQQDVVRRGWLAWRDAMGSHELARDVKDQDGDHPRSGMGLRDADSPARWQDAVATGQTGTRTFRNDQYKVRMTTQRYAAATSCHGEDETDCFAIQDGARMNISRQLRLPFFFWVINPISHSVSKYQQHAQRIPILRCSVA